MRILITGASSGIGRSTFLKAIEKDYYPIAAVRDIDSFQQDMNDQGISQNNYKVIELELESEQSVSSFSNRLKEFTKELDSLVLNAGFIKTSPALMTTLDDINKHLKINYISQILIAQAVIKSFFLKKRNGSIVAISSSAAIDSNPGRLAYASSKSALSTACRVLSKEYGKINIRCNVVAPGLTDTKLMNNSTEKDEIEKFTKSISIQRVGMPDEIANTILFLCSNSSTYITGQVISVDGGIR